VTNPTSESANATAPRAIDAAVPSSRPIAAIPTTAPATTESITATTPGTATNTCHQGGHPCIATDV
jgi:hypothetical protein